MEARRVKIREAGFSAADSPVTQGGADKPPKSSVPNNRPDTADCGGSASLDLAAASISKPFANQRSVFPVPTVAAICCNAYHSDKGKTYCGFNVG